MPPANSGPTVRRQFLVHGEREGERPMTYKIVARKEDTTVRSERNSLLIAAAKARIWAEEGWDVSVTDSEGRKLERAELDNLFAA